MAWSGQDRRGNERRFVGRTTGFGGRQRVYQMREALEIDEIEGYEVSRHRVFYDDVLLVTFHRFRGRLFVILVTLMVGLFGLLSIAMGAAAGWQTGTLVFSLTGLPFLIALVLRLWLRVDVVTVYGRRTKAEMQFHWRKARARQVYSQICRAVRQAHERARIPRGRGLAGSPGARPAPAGG
jgi:hypothetical protein